MEYTVLKHKNSIIHLVNPLCMSGYGRYSKGRAEVKFTPHNKTGCRLVLCNKVFMNRYMLCT